MVANNLILCIFYVDIAFHVTIDKRNCNIKKSREPFQKTNLNNNNTTSKYIRTFSTTKIHNFRGSLTYQ